MMAYIYWTSIGLIAFAYLIGPLLIVLRGCLFAKPVATSDLTPTLSVVIAAYNEARCIRERIRNVLEQDYPADCLEVVIASDGSTDDTNRLVNRYGDPRVVLVALPRQGKGAALNQAVRQARGEILVFSDANTMFASDAIRQLTRAFADPQVGGVAGNQIYTRDQTDSLTADGECAYWDFDRMLKVMQSRAGSVTSATGAIYGIRRELFENVPADAMDDFFVSTGVVAHGKRLVFSEAAVAYEPVAVANGVEYQRKLRIITQGLRAVWHRRQLLNPFRFGWYSFQLLWHKVLRRMVAVPLLLMLLSNAFLWNAGLFHQITLLAQVAFYVAALLGWILQDSPWIRFKGFTLPYFFCVVNSAALVSLFNCLFGRKIGRWNPERHSLGEHNEAVV